MEKSDLRILADVIVGHSIATLPVFSVDRKMGRFVGSLNRTCPWKSGLYKSTVQCSTDCVQFGWRISDELFLETVEITLHCTKATFPAETFFVGIEKEEKGEDKREIHG